ncbi:PglZ domain-containing protein [Armatimonas sp.]|uniref:PglZ domain-containing protein n=1 Tax=Armatimonas sp. TaxID=1872638 RepID=UPI00286BE1D4|nr:PglZ domain-containing protein [Armatimonas sp.]
METIIAKLKPAFGGIPTFCVDSDNLLDVPQVREALRAAGMTIEDWDGQPTSLAPLKQIGENDKPLLIVADAGRRHIVNSCLTDFRWESVTIGELMPKFALDVVKSVPTERWDHLMELHREVRSPRNAHETALLVGRALYGVDPEFLRHGSGWLRTLGSIAVGDDPLPAPVAHAIAQEVAWPPTLPSTEATVALSEPAVARTVLLSALQSNPGLTERATAAEQILLGQLAPSKPKRVPDAAPTDLLAEWEQKRHSAQDVLEFGILYAKAVGSGGVPHELRRDLDQHFYEWLKQNYGLMLSSPNPAILRLPTLLDRLDKEIGDDRLLLLVVDSLSLRAWEGTRKRWLADGIIGDASTRAAFAILPTITSLSRRAIFEGKSPSQFSSETHSTRLERQLWTARYQGEGDYYTAEEALGMQDSFAKARRRVCLVDVSWDKRGHSINPRLDSIEEAVHVWAGKTPLRDIVRSGLAEGYRVILTADHGQVECRGQGRPKVGALPEERSKRVLTFDDKTVCASFSNALSMPFHPSNLPTNLWPLFAMDFASYDIAGAEAVSHGGLSIEEVLVPVVEMKL